MLCAKHFWNRFKFVKVIQDKISDISEARCREQFCLNRVANGADFIGHGPHFYKWLGTGAPWVEEQQTINLPNCTGRHESAHQNDYCAFRAKIMEGHDQKKFFFRAGLVPPLSLRTGAPIFEFVPASSDPCECVWLFFFWRCVFVAVRERTEVVVFVRTEAEMYRSHRQARFGFHNFTLPIYRWGVFPTSTRTGCSLCGVISLELL